MFQYIETPALLEQLRDAKQPTELKTLYISYIIYTLDHVIVH